MDKRWIAPAIGCGLLLLTGCGTAPGTDLNATAVSVEPEAKTQSQVSGTPPAAEKAVNSPSRGNEKKPPVNDPPPGQSQRPPVTGLERAYIERAGMEGVDPAAVLEAGSEVCSRLAFLQKIDPETALGSVVSGEVPDAALAIKYLCPDYSALLARAASGFPDGEFGIGQTAVPSKRIISGKYSTVSASPECNWQIYNNKGKLIASGEAAGGNATITVDSQASRFNSTGCYAWVPVK